MRVREGPTGCWQKGRDVMNPESSAQRSNSWRTLGFSALVGLLPSVFIIFVTLLGLFDAFLGCTGGNFPCSKIVSDTFGFVKITGPLYAAIGFILAYTWPTQVLPTAAGLGLPLLLFGILYNVSGIPVDFRPAASQWLVVNTLIFGIPPLAGAVGALIGAWLRSRRRWSR